MLCTCETQGTQQTEVRTLKWSPGAGAKSIACKPAAFISYFCYLFGFQFRETLPSSSQHISQVHTVIGRPTLPVMQWMEIGIQTSASVHTLTKKTILGGE